MTNKYIRGIHEQERAELILREYHPIKDSLIQGLGLITREALSMPSEVIHQTRIVGSGALRIAKTMLMNGSGSRQPQLSTQDIAAHLG